MEAPFFYAILANILFISSAEKAHIVCVRILPREPAVKAVISSSLGASFSAAEMDLGPEICVHMKGNLPVASPRLLRLSGQRRGEQSEGKGTDKPDGPEFHIYLINDGGGPN